MMQALKQFHCIYRVMFCCCLLLIGATSLWVATARAQTVVYNTPNSGAYSLLPDALLGLRYELTSLPPFRPNELVQAQAQMPSDLCLNLYNSYACHQAREQYLLNHAKTGVLRQGKQLTIPIKPPYAITLIDQQGEGSGDVVGYTYIGFIPEIQYHHVVVAFFEGSRDLLIQAQSGEITVVLSSPMFSPNYQYFVTSEAYPGNPIALHIWQVGSSHLNLEADLIVDNMPVEQMSMQIKQQHWLEPTKVQLDLVAMFTQIPHTLVFTKTGEQWQGYQDDVQIKSLPLYPLTILQENPRTVFEVDTLAVGKRVYQDRDYTFKQVPDYLVDAQYLRLGNNALRNSSADYLHFSLAQPAIVYIAIDDQALHLPDWMAGWQPTPDFLLTDDTVNLRLYKKEVPASIVTLGGNWATGAAGIRSQYIVIVTNKE